MQYPVIYDISSRFFVVIASAVIVLAWLTVTLTEERKRKKESQKIDDLPVLATCQSATSVMLSSTSNCPIAHGSTR